MIKVDEIELDEVKSDEVDNGYDWLAYVFENETLLKSLLDKVNIALSTFHFVTAHYNIGM